MNFFCNGHGTAPDLMYTWGVLDPSFLDPISFDKKNCTIVIFEMGFCKDLGCDTNLAMKTEKYSPLISALEK